MKRAAAYIRVSTEEQTEFSPEAQKRAILQYANQNQICLNEEFIFIDEGISGRNAEKRPAFLQMIAAARKKPKPFDCILVHKFDRFARNREDSVIYKSLLRKECDIRVISITEQMEDDKFSIILESMLEAMAEYYSLNLADEVKKGMFEKAHRGEHIGKAPYGYNLVQKQLTPNVQEIEIVKKIFDLYGNHRFSITKISRFLNDSHITTKNGGKWRNITIRYLLQNPVYAGFCRYNYTKGGHRLNPPQDWIITKSSHPAAISEDLFFQVQEKIKQQSSFKQTSPFFNQKTTHIKSWCQHLAVCDFCGQKLSLHSCNGGSYSSFLCSRASSGLCSARGSWSNRKIESLVSDRIQKDFTGKQTLFLQKAEPNTTPFQYSILYQKKKELQEKKILAKNAYLSQIDSLKEYQETKQKLHLEEAEIDRKLKSIPQEEEKKEKEKLKIETLADFFSSPSFSLEEKNTLAKQFLFQIRINLVQKEIKLIYYVKSSV